MGRRSVERGKAWEREVANRLTEATGLPFVRTLCEARDGNVGDVRCEAARVVVQAKAGARPRIYASLAEAIEAAEAGELPVGAVKRTHGRGVPAERFAVIPWEAFLGLIAQVVEGGHPE